MNVLLISVRSQKSKGGIAVWTEHFIGKCEKNNIEYHLVNTEVVGKRQTDGAANRNLLDEFIRTRRIFKDLKRSLRNDFDVAHLNTSCGTFGLIRDYFVAKKIKKKRIKLAVHFHCDIPYWVKSKISRHFLYKLVLLSDINMVLCDNSARFLKENFDIDSVKVPNFVDDKIIVDAKKINEKINTACFVGSITGSKGIFEIFELAKRFPDIRFQLVGVVSEEVQGAEKPDNVFMPGAFEHSKIIEYLDESDIFVFPSHSEGFSMALAESMARGVPAIATDVGANKDMLEEKGGYIVEVKDVDAMCKAISELEDQNKRNEISQWLVNKVKNNYTIDMVFEKIIGYYTNI